MRFEEKPLQRIFRRNPNRRCQTRGFHSPQNLRWCDKKKNQEISGRSKHSLKFGQNFKDFSFSYMYFCMIQDHFRRKKYNFFKSTSCFNEFQSNFFLEPVFFSTFSNVNGEKNPGFHLIVEENLENPRCWKSMYIFDRNIHLKSKKSKVRFWSGHSESRKNVFGTCFYCLYDITLVRKFRDSECPVVYTVVEMLDFSLVEKYSLRNIGWMQKEHVGSRHRNCGSHDTSLNKYWKYHQTSYNTYKLWF